MPHVTLFNDFAEVEVPVPDMPELDRSPHAATYATDSLTLLIATLPLTEAPDDPADRLIHIINTLYGMEQYAAVAMHEEVDAASDPELEWFELNGTDEAGETLFWIMGFVQTTDAEVLVHYLRIAMPADAESPLDRAAILQSCNENFRPRGTAADA